MKKSNEHAKHTGRGGGSGPTAGPESGANLKSGLAERYQVKTSMEKLGQGEGEGNRPKGFAKGQSLGDGWTTS